MTGYVLLVDIGNTSTTLGLGRNGRVIGRTAVSTARPTVAAVRGVVGSRNVVDAMICCVVPGDLSKWRSVIRKACGIRSRVVTHELVLGISLAYPKPESIGPDRLANACGAVARYGAPVIVADFGTALTFDVVSKEKEYIGGVIAPGLSVMTDHLHEKTALLPKITLRNVKHCVGKTTVEAMRIGARIGYRGMVREIINHLRGETGGRNVHLCATGGYAEWVLSGSDLGIVLDAGLTLYGLLVIYGLNRN